MYRSAIITVVLVCSTAIVAAQPALLPHPVIVSENANGTVPEPPPAVAAPAAKNDFIEIDKTSGSEFSWSTISEQKHVNWNGLLLQSSLFLGVQHSFRLATEQGTRTGMQGPFFKNYFRAV